MINLCGYITCESGLGQSVRNMAIACDAAYIPYVAVEHPGIKGKDPGFDSTAKDIQPINIVHINPDFLPAFWRIGPALTKRYNIAVWYWETENIPKEWLRWINAFDEFWAPSTFVAKALQKVTDKPVTIIPPCISVPELNHLPSDSFRFLTSFSPLSGINRKNPHAVIDAYLEAFGDRRDVSLLLHVNGDMPADVLRRASGGNIGIVPPLTRNGTYELMANCDCYISLHRSEGFGLGMAETMALGKPVIATGYSGPEDFMMLRHSFPVSYEMVNVGAGNPPYSPHDQWAEPDKNEAIAFMKLLVEEPQVGIEIGRRAKAYMGNYSPKVIGGLIKRRLQEIRG